MKNTIIILLSFFLLNTSYAQKWFPQNARWVYNFETTGSTSYNIPFEISYQKDTVIEGKTCRKFTSRIKDNNQQWRDYTQYGNFIAYDDTTSRIQYIYLNSRFQVLYNFNLIVGDTLFIPAFTKYMDSIDQDSGAWVKIDSATTDTIMGIAYRTMHLGEVLKGVQGASFDWVFKGKIIEGIGNINMPCPIFKRQATYVPNFVGLRCYSGDNLNINFSPYPCDTIITTSIIDYNEVKNKIRIFPNPTSENINIDISKLNNYQVKSLCITDNAGKNLIEKEINNEQVIVIPSETLKPGLYLLTIKTSAFLLTYKFTKQ